MKHWSIGSAITIFIILSLIWIINPCNIIVWFFGGSKNPSEIFTYIGVVCGAVIIIGNLHANNKRNLLSEKGQLDVRFKDAATLLASGNTSASLSGIYALNQIAIESSKDSNKGYIEIIHNILCAYIKDKSNFSIEKDPLYPNAKKCTSYDSYNTIIVETIIKILFGSNIYKHLKTDLSNCLFLDIDLSELKIENANLRKSVFINVNFTGANLSEVCFQEAILDSTRFTDSQLENSSFHHASLYKVQFLNTQFFNVSFFYSTMILTHFPMSKLHEVSFCATHIYCSVYSGAMLTGGGKDSSSYIYKTLKSTNFTDAILVAINFQNATIDENVGFSGTVLDGRSIEEIIANSHILTEIKE